MKICNLNYLKKISPENPAFLKDMVQLFLKNAPISMGLIKNGMATNDWDTVQMQAHKLRSHIDVMGMSPEYGIVAKQIEENAFKQQNLKSIASLVSKLDAVFEKATKELQKELEHLN